MESPHNEPRRIFVTGSNRSKADGAKPSALNDVSAAIRLQSTERRLTVLKLLVRLRNRIRRPTLQLGMQVCNLKRGDHLLRLRATGELDHGFTDVGVIHREAIGCWTDFEHHRRSSKEDSA